MSQVNLVNVRGSRVLPNLPLSLPFMPGEIYHVKPYSGVDTNSGLRPDVALKTLTKAQEKATANQNDVVLLYSQSNSAANTTDYQSATLTWAKDLVHLIGVNSGNPYNQRSRIAWKSDAASASDIPLFTLSADGCLIANLSMPVGSSDANLSFGLNITGDRNRLINVSVPWPTNDANDVAGAYALKLDGCDETTFEDCILGSFTIGAGGAANSTILIDSGCSMVVFKKCRCIQRIESTTNTPFVKTADAGAVGFGCLWFENCGFIATSIGGAVAQAGAMTIHVQNDGRIILDPTCYTNAGKWDNSDSDMILISGPPTPAADTAGVCRAV